jgi:hypothetical protein
VNYIAGIMMVVMVVALGFVYFKYIKQSSVKHRDVEPQTAQDLLGISEIRNGILSIDGNRYCKIVAVGSINYYLLSPEEQNMVNTAFGSLLASVNFPIQMYIQTRLLDLSEAVERLRKDIAVAPKSLQPYGFAMKSYLEEWIGVRSVMLRNPYMVIIYEGGSFTEARRDLKHREQLVIEGLSRCGLQSRVLSDDEIADLFYAIYNSKTRALIAPLKEALDNPMYVRERDGGIVVPDQKEAI